MNENGTAVLGNAKNSRIKRYAPNVSIPAECRIIDETTGQSRTIRYIPGEPSIYKDKQNVEGNVERKKSKPKFENGYLFVPANQTTFHEFMDKHPSNEKNQHWRLPNQKAIFLEHNPAKIANERNKTQREEAKATELVYSSDFETKIIPMARFLRFDVTRDSAMILYDMMNYAKKNPAIFIELLDSAKVERFDKLCQAVDFGIIKFDNNAVKWPDGSAISSTPRGYESLEFFAEMSSEPKYRDTWNFILREIKKHTNQESPEEVLDVPITTAMGRLNGMNMSDLYEVYKEADLFDTTFPTVSIGDQWKAKGKKNFVELMEENEELVQYMKAQLVSE